MKRFWSATSVAFLLGGLVMLGWLALPGPARSARPYEGTTLRTVVNAEFVKYSLSLVEGDLYDKLGIKLETEVIPGDAFVAKTLLEFNSGQSPWDLVMFGPSNMPDYGRHFEPLDPWIQKLKLDFGMDDIVPVSDALALKAAAGGKVTLVTLDGQGHNSPRPQEALDRMAAFLKTSVGN
jgi:ABC-type glycerol-3-phosphate transport system substrate-binding protein